MSAEQGFKTPLLVVADSLWQVVHGPTEDVRIIAVWFFQEGGFEKLDQHGPVVHIGPCPARRGLNITAQDFGRNAFRAIECPADVPSRHTVALQDDPVWSDCMDVALPTGTSGLQERGALRISEVVDERRIRPVPGGPCEAVHKEAHLHIGIPTRPALRFAMAYGPQHRPVNDFVQIAFDHHASAGNVELGLND